MKATGNRLIFFCWAQAIVAVLLLACLIIGLSPAFAAALLPEGLTVKEVFKPGHGKPVGRILLVQGKVVIIHDKTQLGYWAKSDTPLYKGDTLITLEQGRVRYMLNDESVLTMASTTTIVLSRSDFEAGKSRASFLKMDTGKARFYVKKILNVKQSEFKVKTPTAVVGVRGSQWDQVVTDQATEVTTHDETTLEVTSVAAPEEPPTVLEDFQRTVIEEGELPSAAEDVDPGEIEAADKEFSMDADEEPAGKEPETKEQGGKGEKDKSEKTDKDEKVEKDDKDKEEVAKTEDKGAEADKESGKTDDGQGKTEGDSGAGDQKDQGKTEGADDEQGPAVEAGTTDQQAAGDQTAAEPPEPDTVDEPVGTSAQGLDTEPADTGAEVPPPAVDDTEIYVPEEELVQPADLSEFGDDETQAMEIDGVPTEDMVSSQEETATTQDSIADDIAQDIIEEITSDILEDLPQFPEPPNQ